MNPVDNREEMSWRINKFVHCNHLPVTVVDCSRTTLGVVVATVHYSISVVVEDYKLKLLCQACMKKALIGNLEGRFEI